MHVWQDRLVHIVTLATIFVLAWALRSVIAGPALWTKAQATSELGAGPEKLRIELNFLNGLGQWDRRIAAVPLAGPAVPRREAVASAFPGFAVRACGTAQFCLTEKSAPTARPFFLRLEPGGVAIAAGRARGDWSVAVGRVAVRMAGLTGRDRFILASHPRLESVAQAWRFIEGSAG